MHQSFTGNPRKPRNVNLSGKQQNPWSNLASNQRSSVATGSQQSLAHAQAERIQRQQERDRLKAAKVIQRTWRSYSWRQKIRNKWRAEWLQHERLRTTSQVAGQDVVLEALDSAAGPPEYSSTQECYNQMKLLVHFVNIKEGMDRMRLIYFTKALQSTLETADLITGESWLAALNRLQNLVLKALPFTQTNLRHMGLLLQATLFFTRLIPRRMARNAKAHYSILGSLARKTGHDSASKIFDIQTSIRSCMLALLQPIGPETAIAYRFFALKVLSQPDILTRVGGLALFKDSINPKVFTTSVLGLLDEVNSSDLLALNEGDSSLWLLAHFLYFRFHAYNIGSLPTLSEESDSVKLVTLLLGSRADTIAERLQLGDIHTDMSETGTDLQPLPLFVREQLLTLVEKASVVSLLDQNPSNVGSQPDTSTLQDASDRAAYALVLLRAFPNKRDDIRLWLFQGSGTHFSNQRHSASMYLWRAARATSVFGKISESDRNTIRVIRQPANTVGFGQTQLATGHELETWKREWTVILLFFEIYTFILKFMDDEDFLYGVESFRNGTSNSGSTMKAGALPLGDIVAMITFLKHMALPLYLKPTELTDVDASVDDAIRLSAYFGTALTQTNGSKTSRKIELLAGSDGVSKDYLQGLVTGILRMIYEKDSRRKFLAPEHWLMLQEGDINHFISAVVEEEQHRHEVEGDAADELEGDFEVENNGNVDPFHARLRRPNAFDQQVRQRRQEREARRRKRELVAPWTEVLRNLPFLVPFDTRVRIFREFVFYDQVRRRGGKDNVDPEVWRLSHMPGGSQAHGGFDRIQRHSARIRRDNVFESAFEQFYQLGEDLANPIQITFIDKFGAEEAGIDGGGVTKEFLNSVTQEAFDPNSEPHLFEENDQHLLYPNPGSLERSAWMYNIDINNSRSNNSEVLEIQRELARRYRFLGRVIGKCLYEGILVDISFAGFFLMKWALTGGTTTASNETSYRATVNDLREYDESLYRGLLQLKNYPGNVEDFGLNFTIDDTVVLTYTLDGLPDKTRTHTRELIPHGAKTAVTNQNRPRYIYEVARHRLQNAPKFQTQAFLQGLSQIISPSWLAMFNQSELQTLVGGDRGEIDITDLRRNTQYGGVYIIGDDNQEHPTVQLFWQVMKSLPNADRAKVLKFVTSTPRAPLLGFKHLNPPFSIRDSSGDDARLPSTSTCVNLLKLPRYRDLNTLKAKLLYAVNSGAGFDLS
ncbi:MAG: hypothetical protein Q9227_000871 [Pyrenula ochraceoflavens]